MRINNSIANHQDIAQILSEQGFCLLSPEDLKQALKITCTELSGIAPYWENLSEDTFLKDSGKYRFRRHSSYEISGEKIHIAPHRAHWQPVEYNALHGGISRLFDPISPDLNNSPEWQKLISGIAPLLENKSYEKTWFTEAHQFRINTIGGIGRPTPEGAHRDGVDYVAILLINRHNIKGGETRLFEIDSNQGIRFTLEEPWSMLLINDHRIIHETTPIQNANGEGYRDTLVLTFRLGGFQEPNHKSLA